MQALILFTALAAIASAGPAFVNRDDVKQESWNNGVLRTIKRERKSPIEESPSELSSDLRVNAEPLPSNTEKELRPGKISLGFRKPIIVKKKFGYQIYRDSDEELAQAEPRDNCRRQFRFKLCDDGDQASNSMRSFNTEDVDESDVEHSFKMAKEAVEMLQRDLEKIERHSKVTQKNHPDEELEDEPHKKAEELRQQRERETISNDDASLLKSIATKSEETRMAEWKEAIESIQKNVEIVKNIEDTFRSSERNRLLSGEELDLSKSRKTESLESTLKETSHTKDMKVEQHEDIKAKNAEENMETYATDNKESKFSLISDNLKVEKESNDLMRHVESEINVNKDKKIQELHDDIDIVQGKNADTNLKSSQEFVEKIATKDTLNKNINSIAKSVQTLDTNDHIQEDIKELAKTDKLDLVKNLENIEGRSSLKSNKENFELFDDIAKTNNAEEDIQSKAALQTMDQKVEMVNENKFEMKDAETSESRILVKSDNELSAKEANIFDSNQEKSSTHTTLEKSVNALDSKETTMDSKIESLGTQEFESRSANEMNVNSNLALKTITALKTDNLSKEHSQVREPTEDREKEIIVEPKPKMELDLTKSREVEDKDTKIIPNDKSQARSVESEQTEKLFSENNGHNDVKIAKSVSAIDSEVQAHNIQEANKNKMTVDKVDEKQNLHEDSKLRKVEEHLKTQHLQNKLETNNNRELHQNNLRFVNEFGNSHDHVPSDSAVNFGIPPAMKMSEMDYYNDLNSQHQAELTQDNNIDFHSSAHVHDGISNWNHNNYHNMHEPYLPHGDRWPLHRYRSDMHLDTNTGPGQGHIHQHNHAGKMHIEDDSHHLLPMGRFVNNPHVGNQHELKTTMMKENMQEIGRESEWDAAMQPSMHMNMRDAFDKNGMPWGYRHAGFGSSMPLVGPGSSGSSAVGLFPNTNGGCGIPLLLSCSPSVVSGSLAKPNSLGLNGLGFRSGDNLRLQTKRDAFAINEMPNINVKTFSLPSP